MFNIINIINMYNYNEFYNKYILSKKGDTIHNISSLSVINHKHIKYKNANGYNILLNNLLYPEENIRYYKVICVLENKETGHIYSCLSYNKNNKIFFLIRVISPTLIYQLSNKQYTLLRQSKSKKYYIVSEENNASDAFHTFLLYLRNEWNKY